MGDDDVHLVRPVGVHHVRQHVDTLGLGIVGLHGRTAQTIFDSQSAVEVGDHGGDRATQVVAPQPLNPSGLGQLSATGCGVESGSHGSATAYHRGQCRHTNVNITIQQTQNVSHCNFVGRFFGLTTHRQADEINRRVLQGLVRKLDTDCFAQQSARLLRRLDRQHANGFGQLGNRLRTGIFRTLEVQNRTIPASAWQVDVQGRVLAQHGCVARTVFAHLVLNDRQQHGGNQQAASDRSVAASAGSVNTATHHFLQGRTRIDTHLGSNLVQHRRMCFAIRHGSNVASSFDDLVLEELVQRHCIQAVFGSHVAHGVFVHRQGVLCALGIVNFQFHNGSFLDGAIVHAPELVTRTRRPR